jgi:hypothetical protein
MSNGGTKPRIHEKNTFQDGKHKGGGANEQEHAGPGRPSKTPPGTPPGHQGTDSDDKARNT